MDKLYAGPRTLPPFESERGRYLRLPGGNKDPRDEKNEKDERDKQEKKRRDDDDCVIVPVPCIIIGAGVNKPGPGAAHA
jgi:hypothetical protein